MDTIKQQVEFQRKKIEERKEKVATRLEKSREAGTYDAYINQEMIVTFSQQLKKHHLESRSDSTVALFMADIEKRVERGEIYIDKNTSIYNLLSVITFKFVISRVYLLTTRSDLVFSMADLYGWESAHTLYLIEKFLKCFPEKFQKEVVYVPGDHKEKSKWEHQLFLSEEFSEELEQHETALIASQRVLWPLQTRPKPWEKLRDQPFHDPLLSYQLVRRASHPQSLNIEVMAETANNLAETSFRINSLVLDRAKEEIGKGNYSVFKSKKYKKFEDRTKRGSKTSLKRVLKSTVTAADYFRDKEFWHVWTFDHRGRCYAADRILDPQGSEFQKSLHLASEATPVGESGIRELKIALMNSIGDDKISLAERVKKAEGLLESGTLGQWVLGTDNGWMNADEPFFALTYANELVKWKASGYDYNMLSDVLIQIDASCSGMQILTAALKDHTLAPLVNLHEEDKVGDLYTKVAKTSYEKYGGPLKEELLSRTVHKTPTMTVVYGVTTGGAFDFYKEELLKSKSVQEWLTVDEGKDLYLEQFDKLKTEGAEFLKNTKHKPTIGFVRCLLSDHKSKVDGLAQKLPEYEFNLDMWKEYHRNSALNKEVTKITKLFFEEVMPVVAPQAFTVMGILKSWATTICNSEKFKQSNVIRYTSPSGMVVVQYEMQFKKERVKATISGKGTNRVCVQATINTPTDQVNTSKQVSSFSPNLVHATYSTIPWKATQMMTEKGMPCLHCHDAFGSTAGNSAEMGQIVRQAFYSVVKDNPFEVIKKELESSYNVRLQELPAPGNLDVKVILKSLHAFR